MTCAGTSGDREIRPPGVGVGLWLGLKAKLTGLPGRGEEGASHDGETGPAGGRRDWAGPRARPGFLIQPEPAEWGLFILGRKAGAGGQGGGNEAFSKNNNNKNAHLEAPKTC